MMHTIFRLNPPNFTSVQLLLLSTELLKSLTKCYSAQGPKLTFYLTSQMLGRWKNSTRQTYFFNLPKNNMCICIIFLLSIINK